jgi:branched-chain amino acid transport system ATP-binding protein
VTEPILEIEDLSAGYTDEPVVVDFSAAIAPGTITTIIGPNGAGKSTLLRAIYGLNRRFGGTIRFEGKEAGHLSPIERLKLGIGFVPQGRCNFSLMSVRENLELGAYTLPRPAVGEAIDRVVALFPLLGQKFGVLAGNLSGGEQQILETAMVLEAGPRLLLLDEPSLGLSPANQDQVFATMTELRARGLTVLVVEQNAHGALEVSDEAIVMELGRKFIAGTARQIIDDPRVKVAYLGGSAASASRHDH